MPRSLLNVLPIQTHPLPPGALLATCQAEGEYTDCFAADLPGTVSHARFVEAFYTTGLFKLERAVLRWAVRKPSTDAQAAQLAAGAIDGFAAWHVTRRTGNQLLMTDFQGRTRSWLMVEALQTAQGPATRLYFGSAVVPVRDKATGQPRMGAAFSLLLGFHKLYSRWLLGAARARLRQSIDHNHR